MQLIESAFRQDCYPVTVKFFMLRERHESNEKLNNLGVTYSLFSAVNFLQLNIRRVERKKKN